MNGGSFPISPDTLHLGPKDPDGNAHLVGLIGNFDPYNQWLGAFVYVRFAILARSEQSHTADGVFQAAIELRDSGKLAPHEYDWLKSELSWLRMHLKSPSCLREDGNHRAICWFHPRAQRPIEKVRSIAALLEEHGLHVQMLTTDDPGIIIYEDGWQVAAKPRRRHLTSGCS